MLHLTIRRQPMRTEPRFLFEIRREDDSPVEVSRWAYITRERAVQEGLKVLARLEEPRAR